MFWFILGGILFVLGIVFVVLATTDDSDFAIGATFALASAVAVVALSLAAAFDWADRSAKFSIAPQAISNKVLKIEEMRRTYYDPPAGVQFNLDMVNKDLASSINVEIKDLEQYVNKQNELLATWRIKYRLRFWFPCFVKPPDSGPLSLSDYLSGRTGEGN